MNEEQFCELFTNWYGEKVGSIKQILCSFNGKELFEFVNQAINKSKEFNNGKETV